MLVLTRQKNATIHIGDEIAIKIVRVSGNKVRLAIFAPDATRVLRYELNTSPMPATEVWNPEEAETEGESGRPRYCA